MNGGVLNEEFNENNNQCILDKELSDILDQLDHPNNIPYIISLLQAGANPNVQNQDGKTLSYYLDKRLSDILESNRAPLNNIQHISLLLQAGANPNVQNQAGKTLLDYLNKKLSDILESNGDPLSNIQHIILLLEAGANPNVQNQDGKTLLHYLNKKLLGILDELEQNIVALSDHGYIQRIIGLLQVGANPNVQNQAGKTLLDYLNKKLSDILESNGDPLSNIQHIILLLEAGANPNVPNEKNGKTLLHYVAEHNDTDGIRFLLEVIKANPNVRDQSGKTPLHYAAKNNCLQARELLLEAGANPNMQDQRGKTPSEYATEDECRQAIEGLSCSSNDKTTCTKSSDSDSDNDSDYDSDKNKGNPTIPDSSVGERNDCSNSSDNGTRVKSVKSSNCNTEEDSDYYSEDEDSSCSSNGYFFLEDSLLMELEIPLTTDERELIDKFCKGIRGITEQESEESILESIEKIVNEYLNKGIRLNSSCSNDNDNGDKETVTSLIFKEIDDVLSSNNLRLRDETGARERQSDGIADQDDDNEDKVSGIIKRITSSLVSKGGVEKGLLFYNELGKHYDHYYLDDLSKQYKDRKEELISTAYESIVNKSKQPHEYDFKAGIDNQCFYVKYPQDSIIEPVKIFNKAEALKDEALNLKVGIIKIGESIVRVEGTKDGKRNYTDVLKGSIKMSFTTEVGEINIYLSPSEKDGNKIKVEIDEENKAKFNKLKDKSSLGENCLLEGENVSEVISKNFKMSDSVSTEPTETTKDVPRTDFTQAYSQQIDTSVKGR